MWHHRIRSSTRFDPIETVRRSLKALRSVWVRGSKSAVGVAMIETEPLDCRPMVALRMGSLETHRRRIVMEPIDSLLKYMSVAAAVAALVCGSSAAESNSNATDFNAGTNLTANHTTMQTGAELPLILRSGSAGTQVSTASLAHRSHASHVSHASHHSHRSHYSRGGA